MPVRNNRNVSHTFFLGYILLLIRYLLHFQQFLFVFLKPVLYQTNPNSYLVLITSFVSILVILNILCSISDWQPQSPFAFSLCIKLQCQHHSLKLNNKQNEIMYVSQLWNNTKNNHFRFQLNYFLSIDKSLGNVIGFKNTWKLRM